MNRHEMVDIIGSKYLGANIEDIITMVVIRPVVF